jgi:parvulin-like peptidyl-prolyl isomerase
MLKLRRKGVIKWTIWGVVITFGLSIFLMAGMFFSNSTPNINSDKSAQAQEEVVKPKFIFQGEERNKTVALINDKELKVGEVESVFNSIDPQYKSKFATEQGIKHLVDQLVNEKIKMDLARKTGIDYEADQELQKIISSQEADTAVKNAGGFQAFIEKRGFLWEDYKARMKAGIVDRKFREKITQGKAVTDKEVEDYFNKNKDVLYKDTEIENVRASIKDILKADISDEDIKSFYDQYTFLFKDPMQIKISQILINPENPDLLSAQKAEDTEIREYYDKNKKEQFKASKAYSIQQILIKHNDTASNSKLDIPLDEQKKFFNENMDEFKLDSIDHLAVIKVDALGDKSSSIEVTQKEIEDYYAGKKDFYTSPEQARSSHILLKVDPKASEEEWKKAEERANELLAQIKAGQKFEDLAKAHSECPSKEKGGDLDWYGRGQMVPPFEKAAFALKENELSAPVKTRFGYHIIKGTGYRAGGTKSLEDVKDEITRDIQKEKDLEQTKEIALNIAENAVKINDIAGLKAIENSKTPNKVEVMDIGKTADGLVLDSALALKAAGFGVSDSKLDPRITAGLKDLKVSGVSDPVFINQSYLMVKILAKDTKALTAFSMVSDKVRQAYLPKYAKKFYKKRAEEIYNKLKEKIAFEPDTKENIEKAAKIFADLAGTDSMGKTKNAGGSLPRFFDEKQPAGISADDLKLLKAEVLANDKIEPALKSALDTLKPGDFSNVIETSKGYHILFAQTIETIDALPYGLVKNEIRDILIKQKADSAAKDIAREVLDKIKSGAVFAGLAKEYSHAKSAAKGGDLGFIPLTDTIEDPGLKDALKEEIGDTSYRYDKGRFNFGFFIDPEITQELKYLEPGQVSQPVKSRFGYHILKLEQVKEGAVKPFEEVKKSIKKDYLTINVAPEQLRKIYDENLDSYKVGESVTVRQAVCGSEIEARKVLELAKEGKDDFVDIIKKYSRSPSAASGGLMTAQKGEMYQVWEDAVFPLAIGEYSEPVQTTMGWHVVRMESKSEARVIPFEEKKDVIKETELERIEGEIYSRFLDKLSLSTRPVYVRDTFSLLSKLTDYKY